MSITLRQLANHINVAPSTVSRALSHESGVSNEKAEEIRQIAASLGYRPKPLRRQSNKTIGLIISSDFVDEVDDAYQVTLLNNAMSTIADAGWYFHSETVLRDGQLSPLIKENRVDGVILSGHPDKEFCDKLLKIGMPAVVLDDLHDRTGLPSILADVNEATQELLGRLRKMGHRRIAMIGTADRFPSMSKRIESFTSTLSELPVSDRKVVQVGYSTLQQGQIATRQLMQGNKPPTALVYATDRLAIGGMIELARLGLDVPHDVSIVSYDNSLLARETDPGITSVDLNMRDMVAAAFYHLRLLCKEDVKESEINPQVIVASKVVWRNSCGPASSCFQE